MAYLAQPRSLYGFVCPHCLKPLRVHWTERRGIGVVLRSRRCPNSRCPHRRKHGEPYAETTIEERPKEAHLAVLRLIYGSVTNRRRRTVGKSPH